MNFTALLMLLLLAINTNVKLESSRGRWFSPYSTGLEPTRLAGGQLVSLIYLIF